MLPVAPFTSTEAKYNWIRNSLAGLQEGYPSGAALLRDLRATGIGIREQEFYNIRRQVLGLNKWQEQIARLLPDTLVPRAWMNEDHGWTLSESAYYRFTVTGTDPRTGETGEWAFAYGGNEQFTTADAEEAMRGRLGMFTEESGVIVDEIDLDFVLIQPGAILENPYR